MALPVKEDDGLETHPTLAKLAPLFQDSTISEGTHMLRYLVILISLIAVSSCARTAVTPIARNQILLSTSAAPACGRTGAAQVASKMAAVETLRRGFQRFVILGAGSASNVSAISTGPTYANTTATVNTLGNTAYGSATTTYGGQGIVLIGSNDADLRVLMINPGEPGFDQGIDAKDQLGDNWQELVQNGVRTCAD